MNKNMKLINITIAFLIIIAISVIFILKKSENYKTVPNTADFNNSKENENVDKDINNGKVVIRQYVTDNCIYCVKMEPILANIQDKYLGRVVIEKIDLYENLQEVNKYSIRSTPTQLYFSADGTFKNRTNGMVTEEEIITVLKSLGVE